MTDQNRSPAERIVNGAERPARVVLVVCRMILGAGLAVALIIKVYMAVLTDHTCATGVAGLGNAIRCTPTLELMAYGLALSAGLDLAYRLFAGAARQVVTPLILGIGAGLLKVLATIGPATMNWQVALVILVLGIALIGVFFIRERFMEADRD